MPASERVPEVGLSAGTEALALGELTVKGRIKDASDRKSVV